MYAEDTVILDLCCSVNFSTQVNRIARMFCVIKINLYNTIINYNTIYNHHINIVAVRTNWNTRGMQKSY